MRTKVDWSVVCFANAGLSVSRAIAYFQLLPEHFVPALIIKKLGEYIAYNVVECSAQLSCRLQSYCVTGWTI